jgi:hypothetical protein
MPTTYLQRNANALLRDNKELALSNASLNALSGFMQNRFDGIVHATLFLIRERDKQ